MMGFVGLFFDDGTTVVFEHSSVGATKAINALSTTALQAIVAFGEIVHPVIELGVDSYDIANRTIYNPKLNVIGYVTDKRAREADTLSDRRHHHPADAHRGPSCGARRKRLRPSDTST